MGAQIMPLHLAGIILGQRLSGEKTTLSNELVAAAVVVMTQLQSTQLVVAPAN